MSCSVYSYDYSYNMRTRLDQDPEDLQVTWPDLSILPSATHPPNDIAGIKTDLEHQGCAFIRDLIDPRAVAKARAVVMRHLMQVGLVSNEQGDCVQKKGMLLTGFEEVTHSGDML